MRWKGVLPRRGDVPGRTTQERGTENPGIKWFFGALRLMHFRLQHPFVCVEDQVNGFSFLLCSLLHF